MRKKSLVSISAHPLDEYKFQYKFINGEFSKNFVLEDNKKKDEIAPNDLSAKILDEETDDDESIDISLEVSEDEELVEESSAKKS